MANKEFNNTIGEKIDQSMREDEIAMLGDLLEMPSQETIDMWTREADKRIESKKRQQSRILAACAAIAVVCVSVVMVLKCFALPEAEANPKMDSRIESTMESTTQYESWDKLPDDIKEQFIEFKEFPEGYELEYVEVEESVHLSTLTYKLSKDNKERILVRESMSENEGVEKNVVLDDSEIVLSSNNCIYVKKLEDHIEKTIYSFKYEEVMIDIIVPHEEDENIVMNIIKNAIQ